MNTQHTPVPVSVAKEIAEKFNKNMVIILSYDPNSQLIHTTTYGKNYVDKEWAAIIGDAVTKNVGADLSQKTTYEDFRKKHGV